MFTETEIEEFSTLIFPTLGEEQDNKQLAIKPKTRKVLVDIMINLSLSNYEYN